MKTEYLWMFPLSNLQVSGKIYIFKGFNNSSINHNNILQLNNKKIATKANNSNNCWKPIKFNPNKRQIEIEKTSTIKSKIRINHSSIKTKNPNPLLLTAIHRKTRNYSDFSTPENPNLGPPNIPKQNQINDSTKPKSNKRFNNN